MKNYGKVGVLLGGHSAEREVSLMSGEGVLTALCHRGVNAHPFDPARRDLAELKQEQFDRVFIALHGRYGEDGTIQGALEHLHIPYTGSGVLASALAMNKVMTKQIWLSQDLLTPRFKLLHACSNWTKVIEEFSLPIIVKPVREGSTIGLSKVTQLSQLEEAYAKAAKFGEVMVEEFVEGAELTCALLEDVQCEMSALPVIRIEAPDGNYDYQNKYFNDNTRYFCPAGLDEIVEDKVRTLSLNAFSMLGCRGWGRVDLIQRYSDGAIYLLEANTLPGLTSHSLVPMSAKVVGLNYEELVMRILACARLELQVDLNWQPG